MSHWLGRDCYEMALRGELWPGGLSEACFYRGDPDYPVPVFPFALAASR
jgi:hypothetical protein